MQSLQDKDSLPVSLDKTSDDSSPNREASDKELLKSLRARAEKPQVQAMCVDHPQVIAKRNCAIENEYYCEDCLTNLNGLWISKKYLDYYLKSEWQQIIMVPDQTENSDIRNRINKVKTFLWNDKNIPLIVQGHHKINVQSDAIESYLVLIGRKADEDFLKSELSFIN